MLCSCWTMRVVPTACRGAGRSGVTALRWAPAGSAARVAWAGRGRAAESASAARPAAAPAVPAVAAAAAVARAEAASRPSFRAVAAPCSATAFRASSDERSGAPVCAAAFCRAWVSGAWAGCSATSAPGFMETISLRVMVSWAAGALAAFPADCAAVAALPDVAAAAPPVRPAAAMAAAMRLSRSLRARSAGVAAGAVWAPASAGAAACVVAAVWAAARSGVSAAAWVRGLVSVWARPAAAAASAREASGALDPACAGVRPSVEAATGLLAVASRSLDRRAPWRPLAGSSGDLPGLARSIWPQALLPCERSVSTATTPSRSGTGSQLSNLPGKPARRTSRVWRTASARVTVSSQQSVGRSPTRLVSGASGTISSVAFASAGVSVT